MKPPRTSNELRCFCARSPLLATFGLDADGKVYIHVRVFKQRRIYGEVILQGGTAKIHCRECLRWHQVVITQDQARLQEIQKPKENT